MNAREIFGLRYSVKYIGPSSLGNWDVYDHVDRRTIGRYLTWDDAHSAAERCENPEPEPEYRTPAQDSADRIYQMNKENMW